MDLDRLSDEILMRVISNLPFHDLVLTGRVNKRWCRISKELVTRTTTLDFKDPIFHKLTPDSLLALLTLCSANVEKLIFPPYDFERTEIFGGFEYPNLKELDMRRAFFNNQLLGVMLRNSRNIEVLKYRCSGDLGDITLHHLKTLVTSHGGNLVFLIGRVPNLKYLELECNNITPFDAPNSDDFIARCPEIEVIKSNVFVALLAFWKLNLRHLLVRKFEDKTASNAYVLLNIGRRFLNLETLELGDIEVTSNGIAALAACKNLRSLKLGGNYVVGDQIDDGIRQLSQCHELEIFQLDEGIRMETLIVVVNEFHCLKMLTLASIGDFALTIADAAGVIQSFHRFGAGLTVGINCRKNAQIWISNQVKEALMKLCEEGHSLIEFQHHEFICD